MKNEPDIIKKLRLEEENGTLKSDLSVQVKKSKNMTNEGYEVNKSTKSTSEYNFSNDISSGSDINFGLKKILNLIADPIIIVDSKGKILEMNDKITKALGYNRDDFIGKNVFKTDLVTKKTKAKLIKNLVKRMAGAELKPYEIKLRANNGKFIRFEINASKIDFQGQHADLILFRNIEERDRIQKEIIKWKNRYDAAIKASGFILYDWDSKTNNVSYGGDIKKILGYKKEELEGSLDKLMGIIHPDDKNLFSNTLKNIIKSKSSAELRFRIRKKNGEYIFVEDICNFIEDENGNKNRMIGFIKDISKSKALEDKYKKLYESSQDAIMTIEPPSWKFTSGNKSTLRIFDVDSEEEFIKLGPWDVSPEYQPDGSPSAEKAKKMIQKAVDEGSNYFEWTHKKITGEPFSATVLLTRLKTQGKTIVQATVRDISKEKEAQEAVNKSRKVSENILNAAADGIRIVDKDFKIRRVNTTFSNMLGLSSEKLIGLKCRDVFSSKYCGTKDCSLARCISTGESYQREQIMTCKNGKKIPVLIKVSPLKDKDGNITAIIEDYRDISSIKKAQRKLKENEKKFRQFFETSPDYCYMVAPDGKIIDINKAAKDILGIENKDEAIGTQIIPLVYENPSKAKELVKKWLKNGYLENEQIKIKSKIGTRNVLLSVDNVKDEQGNIIYSILMQKDLTELLEKEKQLNNKVDELERYKKLTVGRELKMIELKKQIKELEKKCSEEKTIG